MSLQRDKKTDNCVLIKNLAPGVTEEQLLEHLSLRKQDVQKIQLQNNEAYLLIENKQLLAEVMFANQTDLQGSLLQVSKINELPEFFDYDFLEHPNKQATSISKQFSLKQTQQQKTSPSSLQQNVVSWHNIPSDQTLQFLQGVSLSAYAKLPEDDFFNTVMRFEVTAFFLVAVLLVGSLINMFCFD